MSAGRNSASFMLLFSFTFVAVAGVGKDLWQAQGQRECMVCLSLNSWFLAGGAIWVESRASGRWDLAGRSALLGLWN